MKKAPTPELALKLIEENKRTKDPYLDLGNCGLTHLPEELGDCVWLEVLTLSDDWYEYEESFTTWIKVLSGNNGEPNCIASISGLEKLIRLKKLFIAGGEHEGDEWPLHNLEILSGFSSLEELDCSNTEVFDLSPLSNLSQLKALDCSSTKISDLNTISNLTSLLALDISNLKKTHILLSPLSGLNSLKTLVCSSSKVKYLEPLSKLTNLMDFSFDDCPIKDCPADVYESGDGEILRAFFRREKEEEQETETKGETPQQIKEREARPHDVKLILLGNSDAGKTSLLHYLETGKFLTERKSTHGLEVHRWLPNKKRFPSLSDVAVSIWDFGGQEYYHGAYRLFMSANAAYLLLWDKGTNLNGRRPTCIKSGEDEVDLEHFKVNYWLDTVRHYGGEASDSPLFVVQNKTDDLGDKDRLPQELHERYGISESFHISLKCGCNQKQFPRAGHILKHFDAELEHALLGMIDETGLPDAWLRVRESLLDLQEEKSKRKNPFHKNLMSDGSLTLGDFEKACETLLGESLNENEGKAIVSTLNRGGVVVYFEESEILKDKVFVKPAELAERIYEVLKTEVLKLGGTFALDQVLDEKKENDFRTVFIEATQSLGLVFPHPTEEGKYIAPQYLPDEHPIEDLYKIASHGTWQSAYWVKVPLFYYKKLLHALVLHYASDGTEARYFWKHGIFFLKNGLRVLVKGLYPNEDESEGILHIGVEQSPSGEHLGLQREIYGHIIRLLFSREGDRHEVVHKRKVTWSKKGDEAPSFKISESWSGGFGREMIPDWLEVSKDGEYFVKYLNLLEMAAADEIRIEATNNSGEKNTVLIRHFEALLGRPPKHAKRVFVSYSHSNTKWLGRLRNHLSGLRRSNDIETWDDQEILPGDQWDKTIKDKLAEAHVFILLLSADFIASNYIWEVELKTAIEKYQEENKVVIPILVEPLDLGGLPMVDEAGTAIQDFEIIPKNADERLQAVSLWQNHEEALAKVAERIRFAVRGK